MVLSARDHARPGVAAASGQGLDLLLAAPGTQAGAAPERSESEQSLAFAAQALAQGRLVAFPTETVYGLGARADDDAAVARIFSAKGRPPDHPLIVHVAEPDDVTRFVSHWPESARRLTRAFWPGPLTVIVPRLAGVAEAAAGRHPTIGLRCPGHPTAQALLKACKALGVPGVAAPSANRFGRVSPTMAQHVRDEFPVAEGGDAAQHAVWLLDGGACEVGIESTIVDCTRPAPALLRPGMISKDAIEAVLGSALAAPDSHSPKASGTLEAHYAPKARVRLMPSEALRAEAAVLCRSSSGHSSLGVYSRSLSASDCAWARRWIQMPDQPALVAQALFAELRRFDDAGVECIWVEEPPAGVAWDGVRDRLQRAAAS